MSTSVSTVSGGATRAVFKYPLPVLDDYVRVDMPRGAELLCVQMQHGTPCVWALVDPTVALMTRVLRIAGTGHPIERDVGRYVGTFQMHGGALVFHVFEVTP